MIGRRAWGVLQKQACRFYLTNNKTLHKVTSPSDSYWNSYIQAPLEVAGVGEIDWDAETGQVITADGGLFKNLHAAGRTAVGLSSRSYVSGLSLADCIFSGRRAGRHIAESKTQ